MNESAALKKVINTVGGKKPKERKPQKAMDAGAEVGDYQEKRV